jgi:hypothetical protein
MLATGTSASMPATRIATTSTSDALTSGTPIVADMLGTTTTDAHGTTDVPSVHTVRKAATSACATIIAEAASVLTEAVEDTTTVAEDTTTAATAADVPSATCAPIQDAEALPARL